MAEDRFGVLWLATFGGLCSYYPKLGTFHRYVPSPGDKHGLKSKIILNVHMDAQGTVWVATDGGLHRMQPRQHPEEAPCFEVFKHQAMDPGSLSGDGVNSLSDDRSGVLWVGTYQTGLNKLMLSRGSAQRNPVVQYSNNLLDPASLSGDMVNAVLEDHEGNLWIGTDGAGLNRVIPPKVPGERLRFERFRADPVRAGALRDDVITALYEDSENRIWAGTFTAGLIRIDFRSGSTSGHPTFRHYRAVPGDPSSLSSDFVTHMYEDSKHRFWVTTASAGLNRFDRETGKAKSYRLSSKIGLGSDSLYSIAEDQFGTLWLGSYPGLNRFNPETERANYFGSGKGSGFLSHPAAFAVHIDTNNNLWVGTDGGGLNKASIPPWDGQGPQFIRYGTENGLPDNNVRGVIEDAKGHLWLSTSHGLCLFDSTTGKGQPFPWRPELDGMEYLRNAHQLFRSGELAFGGIHGFCIFRPDDVFDTTPPVVAITDLKLSGVPVPVGVPVNGRVFLDRLITETPEIVLTAKEYEFSLEFAALHFVSPDRNHYAYMMEGLDRRWNFSDNRNFVTYTTLPPGEYRFRVRAANCDGFWNEEGTSLRIRVLPAWWMRWWFRGLLVLLLVGAVYLSIWTRLKILHARNRLLEETVTARTQELAEANEALLDQSLTDPLTGLRNRRFLYACMPEDVAQVQRVQRDALTNDERLKLNIDVLIVLVDIDHFKLVNDRHGHHAGDMVLQQMSTILQGAVRGSDTVARWGGEEFLIIARNSARADAAILPERIRAAVEAQAFDIGEGNLIHCTCSLGFSVFPLLLQDSGSFTWEQIVDITDVCLYAAKHNGRNAWVGIIPDSACTKEMLTPMNPMELAKQERVPVLSSKHLK